VAGASEPSLRIARLDGGELLLDGGGLAAAFFGNDAGLSLAGHGVADRIDTADVEALNRMGARSPHALWAPLVGVELPWLRATPVDLDLIETGEARWRAVGGDQLVRASLAATLGPGRGASAATKLLHLKRPRLYPMLDAYVAQLLGQPVTAETTEGRTEQAARLILHLRREGRRNLAALRAVRKELSGAGSLIRILDAVLWLAHPGAGGVPRRFTVELLD